jgi:hypothetical protein
LLACRSDTPRTPHEHAPMVTEAANMPTGKLSLDGFALGSQCPRSVIEVHSPVKGVARNPALS